MPAADLADMDPRLAELIEAALKGEEVVFARDGVPVAKLVPIGPRRRREPGRFEGEIVELDPDWWKPDDELIPSPGLVDSRGGIPWGGSDVIQGGDGLSGGCHGRPCPASHRL